MSKELLTEEEEAKEAATQKIGLFTPQPLFALGKAAFWALLIVTLQDIGLVIALAVFNGAASRDSITFGILAIVATILFVTRIRWMQAISMLVGIVILYITVAEPFAIEAFADPKGPNGGFGHFFGNILVPTTTMVALVAGITSVLRNY